jgi:hypothetical protein
MILPSKIAIAVALSKLLFTVYIVASVMIVSSYFCLLRQEEVTQREK